MKEKISIGLLGMGVVGGGVAKILEEKQVLLTNQIGVPVDIRGVLVRDSSKKRSYEFSVSKFVETADDISMIQP